MTLLTLAHGVRIIGGRAFVGSRIAVEKVATARTAVAAHQSSLLSTAPGGNALGNSTSVSVSHTKSGMLFTKCLRGGRVLTSFSPCWDCLCVLAT